MDQIAVSGKAPYQGIPTATVTWGAPGNQAIASATTHSATIFTNFSKEPQAKVTESTDNDGEVMAVNRRDKRTSYSFSAKIVAATRAAALVIAENPPQPHDVIKIVRDDVGDGSGTDTITAWVDSAKPAFTPDGDAIMEITCHTLTGSFAVVAS